MSRPRSAKRAALDGFVSGGGQFTMRQLAGTLKCKIEEANRLLFRAQQAGEVRQVGTTSVEGAKRPVAVFQSAAVCTEGRTLTEAIQAWGR